MARTDSRGPDLDAVKEAVAEDKATDEVRKAAVKTKVETQITTTEYSARIEGGDVIELTEDQHHQYRITVDGVNYEHVGEEIVEGREAMWVYRAM